jgi:hypothetical protein
MVPVLGDDAVKELGRRWRDLIADLVAAALAFKATRLDARFANPADVARSARALWKAEAEAPRPPAADRLGLLEKSLRRAALQYGELCVRGDGRCQWEALTHLLDCCLAQHL